MAAWPEYGNTMAASARETASLKPLKASAKQVGYGWDQHKQSNALFNLEQCVRAHIIVVSEPRFHMPLNWAMQSLPPELNNQLGAVYAEMVQANHTNGSFGHFKKENLLLCICFRLGYNLQVALSKEAHVAEAMGFEPPKRGTFLATRTRFLVYLKAQPPPPIAPLPPPAIEMLGVHALATMIAPPQQEPPQQEPPQQAPPQQEPPPQAPPPQPPVLGWTMEEVWAAVLGLEEAGELGQISGELEQFASVAAAL